MFAEKSSDKIIFGRSWTAYIPMFNNQEEFPSALTKRLLNTEIGVKGITSGAHIKSEFECI